MALDPDRMPAAARPLIPMAERWGIGDDGYREEAVDQATPDELRKLVASLDGVEDGFSEWLEGPESFAPRPSEEYLAMTALTMAFDSARVKLDPPGGVST